MLPRIRGSPCFEVPVTHHLWVTPIGDHFLLDCVQLTTPCNHQLARCATSSPLDLAMWSLTIYHDHMFEGGPIEPKGMPCHFVIEYFSLLIMDTYGHGLMGGICRKEWARSVLLSPRPLFGY